MTILYHKGHQVLDRSVFSLYSAGMNLTKVYIPLAIIIAVAAVFFWWRYQDQHHPPTLRREWGGDFTVNVSTVSQLDNKPWPKALLGICFSIDNGATCRVHSNISTDTQGRATIILRRSEVDQPQTDLTIIGISGNGSYSGRPTSGQVSVQLLPWIGK